MSFFEERVLETKITSTSSGIILTFYIQDNKNVELGDTLLVIDSSFYEKQLVLPTNRVSRIDTLLSDLDFLIDEPNKEHSFKSNLLRIKSRKYRSQLESLKQNLKQASINFERNKALHDEKVILIRSMKFPFSKRNHTYKLNEKGVSFENQLPLIYKSMFR